MFGRIRNAILGCLVLAGGATAQEASQSVTDIGLELLKIQPPVGDEAADQLRSLNVALGEMREPEDRRQKAAQQQLSGEILFALGQYGDAKSRFESARKEFKDEVFEDDAEFWRILALEAEGRDEDANKAWEKWQSKYSDESPLRGEAVRIQLWNALRRSDLKQAASLVEFAKSNAPWMLHDARWIVAEATLALLNEDAATCLSILDRGSDGPEAAYVRALAYGAQAEPLKAAGYYQKALNHKSSVVRDHAMLAKANIFLGTKVYRSAIEEFQIVLDKAEDPRVRSEASLRHAAAVYMDGSVDVATELLRNVIERHPDSDVAARAQFLLGEAMVSQERYEEAIAEYNQVLTRYFQHSVAASAQYRVGRCLDALERPWDATGAYQAVVAGYPLEPEAPAAAYLAGAGLLKQGDAGAASPYFQIVLDRYTARKDADGSIVFLTPEHQELTDASLCLLAYSYHQTGRLGQLSGAVHLMLENMPESHSPWRAWTILMDADALAAQGRQDEAQAGLAKLFEQFPDHAAVLPANQLLAWSYAQQGDDEKAIAIQEKILRHYADSGSAEQISTARLHMAHVRFNQRRYEEAATEYEAYIARAEPSEQLLPLYQAGLCYQRLGRSGDAVDRWEQIVQLNPSAPISEKAWARAGDVYFAAGHYVEASRCFSGLLNNFSGTAAGATGLLRLAQCAYNAGNDAEAIERYSQVMERYPNREEAMEAEEGLEVALYRLGQGEGGAEALSELVELYPNSSFAADAQFQVASNLYEAKQYGEAAEEFRRVVSQFPNYVNTDRAQFMMGDAYAEAGQAAEAQTAYEQFVAFFPESELARTVHFRLGAMYFESEQYLRTALEFTQVLEHEERDELTSAALFNLALCQRALSDFGSAVASFAKYREEFPNDERALDISLQLAQINRIQSNNPQAIEEYENALRLGVNESLKAEIQYEVGGLYEGLGDLDSALKSYAAAMQSADKKNSFRLSAVARCAAIYEEKEQYSKALAAYQDLAKHADDAELAAAADARAEQLKTFAR